MKRATDPRTKLLPRHATEEPATFNPADDEAISTPEVQDLAKLVWKYFEKEIRETLVEVQEAIQTERSSSTDQVRHRKQKRK